MALGQHLAGDVFGLARATFRNRGHDGPRDRRRVCFNRFAMVAIGPWNSNKDQYVVTTNYGRLEYPRLVVGAFIVSQRSRLVIGTPTKINPDLVVSPSRSSHLVL